MKYIIVGAVAGGASAAARLRRLDEHADIIMFEKGEHISYANCGLPYYIGDVIKDRNKLFVQTASAFNKRFQIDVRINSEVLTIHPAEKSITVVKNSGEVYTETYDKLIISPGAEPLRPPLPGINSDGIFTLRNVQDTDHIKRYIQQKKPGTALVVGGGFIGLEMAENFRNLGLKVTVVEMGNQILAPLDYPIAALIQQHIRSKNVVIQLEKAVSSFAKTDDGILTTLSNGEIIKSGIVLLSIGVRPDTKLAVQAGLKTGAARGIWVNEYLQTSDPDIYAVGDAIEFENPVTGASMSSFLAGPANKQGRICANNVALGNVQSYHGSVNTAIVQVFDMTVATAGTGGKFLKTAKIEHLVSTNRSGSHAAYYPGSEQMTIQITFSPHSGRLLGSQIAGYNGVDKRIDILSSFIQQKKTIYDLTEFEHAYSPPYSSAKDPINMAGYVAENILQGRLNVFYWEEIKNIGSEDLLLDVRSPDEFEAGHIENAVNIPVDEIRGRLSDIPAGKNIYIYCEAGLRGYLTQRILKQNGFDHVLNLSGGYYLWKTCTSEAGLIAG